MKKVLVSFSLFTLIIILLVIYSVNSKNSMTGIYLKSIDGINIIIEDNGDPTSMINKTGKENIFDNLKNGDKILITYDLISETYPSETKIYNCKLIEQGSVNNIPKDTLDKLQELGFAFDLSNN